MSGQAIIGRYYAAESPLHRLDPRIKITGVLLVMGGLFACGTYAGLAVLAAALVVLFALARIPAGVAWRSVAPLLFIVVLSALINVFFEQGGAVLLSAGPVRVSERGVHLAVFMGARLTLLLFAATLLTLTTTTLDLTDAIEDMLRPLARIGFPAHEFSMILGIALRFLPQFSDELRIIRAAQASRGAVFTANPFKRGFSNLTSLMVPLFTSAFRHAETLSSAMDARCYHGGAGRTKLHPLALHAPDGAALAVAAALLACGIAL